MPYFKENRSAVNRRLKRYLVDNRIILDSGLSQEEMVEIYLDHKKIEVPTGVSSSDFVVNLFKNGELYPEYKRRKPRKKMPGPVEVLSNKRQDKMSHMWR